MHSCLRVAEIVLLICEQISDSIEPIDDDNDSYINERTNYMDRTPPDYNDNDDWMFRMVQSRSSQLLALAQTCRNLQQPALQTLWSSINSIAPILQCVGGDLVNVENSYGMDRLHLTRPISPLEAKTMMKYAALVRHFDSNNQLAQDLDYWTALRDTFTGTPLFPNLRTITLSHVTMKFHTLFGMEGLISLSNDSEKLSLPLLVDYSTRCPGLRSLLLGGFTEPDGLRAFAEALSNWPNLSSFSTYCTATPEIIQMLSCYCPRLESIEFGSFDWKPSPVEIGFPMLQRVVINGEEEGGKVADVILFLDDLPAASSIQTLSLQELCHMMESQVITERYWLRLLQTIKKFAHSLKDLSLVERWCYGPIPDNGVLSNALLSDLAAFTTLTRVKLACSSDYSIDDEGVKMLTEALSLLQDFCLSLNARPEGELSYEPQTTALCLTYFAQNCPQLTDLVIPFNAAPKEHPKYPKSPAQGMKLTSLGVSISPIADNHYELDDFILRVFPNIKWLDWQTYAVDPYGSPSEGEPSQEAIHVRRWSRLSQTLKNKIRK